MAIPFESPIDLKSYAVSNLVLGTPGSAAGGLGFTASDGLTQSIADGYPYWYDSVWTPHPILPFYDYEADPVGNGALRAWDGVVTAETFVGALQGNADSSSGWTAPASLSISGGKATAAAVSVNAGATLNLEVTSLAVDADEISLFNGYFLVGDGTDHAEQRAKNSIPLSGFGAAEVSVNLGGQRITSLGYPFSDEDAASKEYVDNLVSGVAPSLPARAATTAALDAYTPAGSPATLTSDANGALTVDGVSVVAGDRVLVKNESGASEKYNGIYEVTNAGSGGTPWILDRAEDADTTVEVNTGDEYFVVEGTANGGTSWALATAAPITLGTTALTFVQTGGGNQYSAGKGLVQVGNVFHFAQDTNYTQFGVPYASGTATIGFTAAGSGGQVFRVPSAGGAPAFGALDLDDADSVTGTLAVVNGGTNIGAYDAGDILYASGTTALARRGGAALGNVLHSGGVSGAPTWGKVHLTSDVDPTSTLAVATGGTGAVTLTSRGVLIGRGTLALVASAAPTIGQFLVGDATGGGSVPKFTTLTGDVTGSVVTPGLLTIANDAVTYAKLQDISTSGVVLGRLSGGPGDAEEITFANLADALMATGNIDPSTTLTGDVAGSGTGSVATTITNLAFSKLANGLALSVLGVAASSPATGVLASIQSPGADRVLRTASNGLSIGFGALNLSSANATSGVLPTSRGGTGTTTSLTFPGVPGAVPIIKSVNLASGSSQYTVAHGMSTGLLLTAVRNSSGAMVQVQVETDATNVVVTFGAPTVVGHTLIIVGSDGV